ncbi:hypothetical protein RB195_005751 [Necator americanus]|uniref:Amino acid transporter transmembrane domain-containing protein n=1 Tax=Necator americanus TaxID=51031 RepID=A0ABR1BPF2_NECAM
MIVSPVDSLPVGFTTSRKSSKDVIRRNGVPATAILTNFVCGMIGPGCFSVAVSFKQSGLWVDEMLTYFSTPVMRTYCLYLSGTLAGIFREVIEFVLANNYKLSKTHIMLMYFLPQLCLSFIKNIHIITFLSVCGNVIIFVAVGLELIFHDKYAHQSLPPVTNFEGVTMAAGGLIYAFEGQAMVLTGVRQATNNIMRGTVDLCLPDIILAPSGRPLSDLKYAVVVFAESSTKLQHVVHLVLKPGPYAEEQGQLRERYSAKMR